MKHFLYILTIIAAAVSCDDPNEGTLFVQPSDVNADITVADVLSQNPEKYSSWVEMLRYTNFYNALKDASAVATTFCPNNEAMRKFLDARGVQTVEELPLDYAKNVVRTHILTVKKKVEELDTAATRRETLQEPTLFENYLSFSYGYTITDVDDNERTDQIHCPDSIFINNQARLNKLAVDTCSNGFIYTMADVITPLTENILERLELYGDYKIFTEAIRSCPEAMRIATLVKDTTIMQDGSASVTNYRNTCLAVPDEVYQREGISSLDQLRQWVQTHGGTADTAQGDALTQYVLYHFLPIQYETAALFRFNSDDETLIYDTRNTGTSLITNKIDGRYTLNKEVHLLRSDIPAANGKIHKIDGIMPLYSPDPVLIRWDFMNYPDIISEVNSYGAAHAIGDLFTTPLASSEEKLELTPFADEGKITSFTYKAEATKSSTNTYGRVQFRKDAWKSAAEAASPKYDTYMNNYMVLNLGMGGWVQFQTPTVIGGRYKIVLHYITDRTNSNSFRATGSNVMFSLDGKQSLIALHKGQKRNEEGAVQATLWGAVDLPLSASHTFRITFKDSKAGTSGNYKVMLDYVEFVPLQ